MIAVTFSERCEDLLRRLEIPRRRLTEAINDRHGLIVMEGFQRMISLGWPATGNPTLVDAMIVKSAREGTQLKLIEVMADLAVGLAPDLPGGMLTRDMGLDVILEIVARSFGYPVSCSANVPPAYVYTGHWDGLGPRVSLEGVGESADVFLALTVMPDSSSCEYVWCFDIERYLAWFRG